MSRGDSTITEAEVESSRAEGFAAWLIGAPMTAILLGLCGFQLATWIPHYLTWPWFADHDVFATMALGWDRGRLPYRDLAGNNFPGTTYLFWILGRTAGWGRTVPLYAFDSALVLALGALMLAWSRRRLGRFLPGLVGYATFLSYYLSLDYGLTAQRDWHGPFFMVAGLLLLESFPGRWTRRLSALTTAIAFVIRPQVVLFGPALLLAIARGEREEADRAEVDAPSGGRMVRVLLGWVVLASLLTGLGFAPLWFSGIWDDFLRGVGHVTYGAGYNKAGPTSIGKQCLLQILHLKFDLIPVAVLALYPAAGPRVRASSRVWLLATLGVWFYKPLSPMPYPYLEHPLTLVLAIDLAIVTGVLLLPGLARASSRLAALLMILAMGVEARPLQCSVQYARRGIEALRRGEDPVDPPLGLHIKLPSEPKVTSYPWDDYRRALAYLRTHTGRDTLVANLVHVVPAINGPAARLTPLPAESLAWLSVHPDAESSFLDAIDRAPADSVVVWTPEMGNFVDIYDHFDEVRRLAPTIRHYYRPEARFGDLEVWRRKPTPDSNPEPPPAPAPPQAGHRPA
jgi:hypothetical protein